MKEPNIRSESVNERNSEPRTANFIQLPSLDSAFWRAGSITDSSKNGAYSLQDFRPFP